MLTIDEIKNISSEKPLLTVVTELKMLTHLLMKSLFLLNN